MLLSRHSVNERCAGGSEGCRERVVSDAKISSLSGCAGRIASSITWHGGYFGNAQI
jgi:hypothetical protein